MAGVVDVHVVLYRGIRYRGRWVAGVVDVHVHIVIEV